MSTSFCNLLSFLLLFTYTPPFTKLTTFPQRWIIKPNHFRNRGVDTLKTEAAVKKAVHVMNEKDEQLGKGFEGRAMSR